MKGLKTLFKDTLMPLPFAREIAEGRNDVSLSEPITRKCISCGYEEEWYDLKICTFDGSGIYGEHSTYDFINVVKDKSYLNDFRIRVDKESLENYLSNFSVEIDKIDKCVEKLNYYKSLNCNDYYIFNHSLHFEKICNNCLKDPDKKKVLEYLNLSDKLKESWIRILKK